MNNDSAMKDIRNFLENNMREDMSEEQINSLLAELMKDHNNSPREVVTEKNAKTADDFMELAGRADSVKDALKFGRKAIKLDPDNLDAEQLVAELSALNSVDLVKKLDRAVKHGNEVMAKQGYMDKEYEGEFWLVIETRPYMRLRRSYVDALIRCGMFGKAISECEDLLRLCTGDNLGVRYTLMHLYALTEREEDALALHAKFDKANETQMLLPLSILYFKKYDLSAAGKYADRLARANKDFKLFLKELRLGKLKKYEKEMSGYGYRPNTIEELIVELSDNAFLFDSSISYLIWVEDRLNSK